MKNEVIDILILGLLVVLFTSIYRKRATARLRCWVIAWILVLLHFGTLLPSPAPKAQELFDSLSLSTLLLSGVCFLFSASVIFKSVSGRLMVALGIGIPALFYTNYLIFDGPRQWPLYLAAATVTSAGITLAWQLCRSSRAWLLITLTFAAGGLWTFISLYHQQPERGILALLSEIFFTFAALYWFEFRRTSAGVVTAILGLAAWAAVFPVGLMCSFFVKQGQIPTELWNVPKYFVAFGMILTLLENEFQFAARATEHYRLLFAAHPHPMWVHDPETLRILEVNDAAVDHYGYSREEFLRMSLPDLRPTEDVAAVQREHSATNSSKLAGPWRHLRKDGSYIQVDMASHSIDFQGRKCSFVLVQDVTDRQQLHEQLVHQAHHDLLTGLPNRLLLEDRMQQTLAQSARYSQQAAILCVDLDRFKETNDNYGHAAGDLCLQQVVARISARLRAVDTFARTGGDEFVILLGELANKNSALTVARGVLESLSQPIEVEGYSFDVSASIGIAIYPDDGTDAAQLRRLADGAMYRAKQAGGGQYLLGSAPAETSEVPELEKFVRNALREDGLELYYQPQYSVSGHLTSLQAVVKLHHPQLGLLPADRFMPVAEECGLIVTVGDWILDEVCRQIMEWQSHGLVPTRVAFHVSPLQFLHGNFSARVLSTLAQTGIDARLLELIVTESTVMRHRPEMASQMRSLAALGIHFSVADFGSSYSSLTHLHQLPVSTLKIDCSFVERISDPNGTYTIVQAIIALAHNLGMKVVGEGVERADQLECLRTLGCDFVQGLLFAPALRAAGIPKYLSSTARPVAPTSRS
jgi:diguanylate cyclase (GGDEF)-like protein/PAS domain S-box-containing protein